MNATTTTATPEANARAAILPLLDGEPPNGMEPQACGPWAETVTALYEAHETGGTHAVQTVFNTLQGTTPGLADLIAGDDAAQRYLIHWASEALEPQPPIDWIIEPLFSAGSVSLLVGEAGSKKTYTLLDAAVAVALGRDWLGHEVQQGPVLLVDEESGPRRMARRLGDVMRGHNAGADLPLAYVTLTRFDLRNPDEVNHLQRAIREVGARFVVIDALADVMPGADENSVQDVQPLFMALRSIAEATQAALVVIHHKNKGGGYRGSTAMKGAVDLLLKVESRPDELRVAFESEKARDVGRIEFAALANFGEGIFNLSPAVVVQSGSTFPKSQRYVLRYLSEHGPATVDDIMGHADVCAGTTARKALYTLTDKGYTTRVDDGGRGAPATYDLTEQGKKKVA